MLLVPLVELSINSPKSNSLSDEVLRDLTAGTDCDLENSSGDNATVLVAEGMTSVRDC